MPNSFQTFRYEIRIPVTVTLSSSEEPEYLKATEMAIKNIDLMRQIRDAVDKNLAMPANCVSEPGFAGASISPARLERLP